MRGGRGVAVALAVLLVATGPGWGPIAGPGETAAASGSSSMGCQGVEEAIAERIRDHREHPFRERAPADPELSTCPEHGAFALAAYGLDGQALVSLSWMVQADTTCDGYVGVATSGTHHAYYVDAWQGPNGTGPIGGGSATSGLVAGAFAGSTDTDRHVARNSSSSWGEWIVDRSFAEGVHRYTVASNAWGAWNTTLTEGASLLLLLDCQASVTFTGIEAASSLATFSDRDTERGVGVDAAGLAETSAGQALATRLPQGGHLLAVGYAIDGAGIVRLQDADRATRHGIGPDRDLTVHRSLPAGPVTVDLAVGGHVVAVLGASYGPLMDVSDQEIVHD